MNRKKKTLGLDYQIKPWVNLISDIRKQSNRYFFDVRKFVLQSLFSWNAYSTKTIKAYWHGKVAVKKLLNHPING
jgi:hypothetical protein